MSVSRAVDVQRVILRLEEAEEDSTYVNTQPGTDYINASHLDVKLSHLLVASRADHYCSHIGSSTS